MSNGFSELDRIRIHMTRTGKPYFKSTKKCSTGSCYAKVGSKIKHAKYIAKTILVYAVGKVSFRRFRKYFFLNFLTTGRLPNRRSKFTVATGEDDTVARRKNQFAGEDDTVAPET
ncbi:hypothetical protein LXL04_024845 [Taraxacum kok-saghyz]